MLEANGMISSVLGDQALWGSIPVNALLLSGRPVQQLVSSEGPIIWHLPFVKVWSY